MDGFGHRNHVTAARPVDQQRYHRIPINTTDGAPGSRSQCEACYLPQMDRRHPIFGGPYDKIADGRLPFFCRADEQRGMSACVEPPVDFIPHRIKNLPTHIIGLNIVGDQKLGIHRDEQFPLGASLYFQIADPGNTAQALPPAG